MSHPDGDRFKLVKYISLSPLLAIAQVISLGFNESITAQITPDDTLGNESSVVTPDNIKGIESDRISGGAERGSNLFHSFQEFNIDEGRGAYFDNPAAIRNIFSRVTGNNPSNIMGTLGVLGNANLFFLNPNGIIFGNNARLDLRGSFLATTADSILFPDGNKFSALNPEAPPLLTVNVQPLIGLEFEGREGIITSKGILEVESGQNLALVGGDLNIDGGGLIAPEGRVDLGGLSEAGIIGINNDGSLSFPDDVARADVFLTNSAVVNVLAGGGGFISIHARNLDLTEESQLVAGIEFGMGNSEAVGGDIVIDTTDTITISQGSSIANQVELTAEGNAGGIKITTNNLSLTQESRIDANTFGRGDAGQINIKALGTVSADGSIISSQVGDSGQGNSEGIEITTNNLFLNQTGRISASTSGQGNAGAININATGNIALTEEATIGANTFGRGDAGAIALQAAGNISLDGGGIFSDIGGRAEGNSEGIEITTNNLYLNQIGRISASTSGQGNAGAININATGDIALTEETVIIASTSGQGNAGAITINATGNISADGGRFVSQIGILGTGNSEGIEITGTDLYLANGGIVDASTFGRGDAGAITINASGNISADGENLEGFPSGVFSQVQVTAEGKAGGIEITTNNLSLTNGGIVDASTFGRGDAGMIKIQAAETIFAEGEAIDASRDLLNLFPYEENLERFSSGIYSQVQPTGEGKAGGIEISTNNLALAEGGIVDASTLGRGDAGTIKIQAVGTVSTEGENSFGESSGIYSQVIGEGKAGGIEISTNNLALTEGGVVDASTLGRGDAGMIKIQAAETIFAEGENLEGFPSGIYSQVIGEGKAGGIEISTNNLALTKGGIVDASTLGRGDAGMIKIQAVETIFAEGENSFGESSGIYSQVAAEAEGNSKGIEISTNNLALAEGGIVDASTFGRGDVGTIKIQAAEAIFAEGENSDGESSGIYSQVIGEGKAGGIEISTNNLALAKGGIVEASTFGRGDAGRITIQAAGTVFAEGENSDGESSGIYSQVAAEAEGNSKGIEISTNNLALAEGGIVDASTFGRGDVGTIKIQAAEAIFAEGENSDGESSGIYSQVIGEGKAGGIEISTNNLALAKGGIVEASTFGRGDAGRITIQAAGTISVEGDNSGGNFSSIISQVAAEAEGKSEGIEITTNNLLLTQGGIVDASTFGQGNAGDIKIDTLNLTIAQGSSISALTTGSGNSGTITINTPQAILITDGSSLTVETSGSGQPGDIFITTPHLTIGKDAEISATATATSTNTEGGGSITLNTSNLDLTGKLGIFAETQGKAPAGTLNIQPYTKQTQLDIEFTDTAILSTLTTASGAGGSINLTAPETINISGEGRITVETESSGKAGNINIETKNLNISNQTEISASTFGIGEAGNINITAAQFNLTEGANIFTNTESSASAGDIQLNITDSINLSGSTIRSGTTLGSTGDGGNIIIDPATMTISNGAEIAVDSDGSGEGGNITLQAGLLTLDNGKITAETASNQGGDITLTLTERLNLRNNSQITATAGTELAGGDGGNINIDAPFIIAFPQENSDITANAFEGNGGDINITSQGIFGIEFRNQTTALSDITASSRFGQQGVVEIDNEAVDPTRGLNNLPQQATETEVAQSCQANNSQTTLEFFDIGRGGLPPTPEDLLNSEVIIAEWMPLNLETTMELPTKSVPEAINQVTLYNSLPCLQ